MYLGVATLCRGNENPVLVQVEVINRPILDAKIAQAIKHLEPIDGIRELVNLARFSYLVPAAELNSSDEWRSFTEYVPAVSVLISSELDKKLVVSEVLDALIAANDEFYRRRLVYVVERVLKKPITQVVKDLVTPAQLKFFAGYSSFGKTLPPTFFIQAMPSPEEQRLIDALHRIKNTK